MPTVLRSTLLALVVFVLAFPASALASTSAGQPFPSDLYTVPDSTQVTGLRIDLPKPDCATHPSDCADIAVLDTLDGFNIQPRISIPFSGPIDLSTVSSSTIFLVGPGGHLVGINQIVWEPAANTLHAESDEQLAQDATYLLVVTRGIHAADGTPLDETAFRRDLNYGLTKDPATKAYRKALLDALPMAMARRASPRSRGGFVPSCRLRPRPSRLAWRASARSSRSRRSRRLSGKGRLGQPRPLRPPFYRRRPLSALAPLRSARTPRPITRPMPR